MTQSFVKKDTSVSGPWWKYGHVWLIISGPLIVVIAGVITAFLAFSNADPVIDENYYENGININKTLQAEGKNMAPAQAVRNHAATPDKDLPSLKP